ncbi:MAG: hypothetical protein DLM55_01680 [Acidimicrobiales bacterium]|nr:MAG: hypothetical protein DLM55_01680 [Acidimicrobiales bacterium]
MWLDRLPTRWQSVVVVSGLAVLVVAVWFFVVHVAPGLFSDEGGGGRPFSASGESSEPGMARSSAKPTPPPLPPAAREQTEAGAETFVRYHFDIENYVQHTNDVAPAKELFDPKVCKGCQVVVDNHEMTIKKGRQLQGGTYYVRSVEAKKTSSGDYLVSVVIDRDATKVIDSEGKQVGAEIPADFHERGYFYLKYVEGKWSILDFAAAA